LADVRIYAWDGQGFSNRLNGTTTDLPYPDIRLVDPDGDRLFDLGWQAALLARSEPGRSAA
jgi:hypothetical protein